MIGKTETFHSMRIWVRTGGAQLASEGDALSLIGEASGADAEWVAVPAEQFAPDFFSLKTRLAGNFLQKLITYGQRIAIVGDIGAHLAESGALGDFVAESNRGRQVWFVADMAELERRLAE